MKVIIDLTNVNLTHLKSLETYWREYNNNLGKSTELISKLLDNHDNKLDNEVKDIFNRLTELQILILVLNEILK